MGIHFACHHCNHSLHVKDFQAGKRGKCPECKGMFRIPLSDATHSLAVDVDLESEPVSVVAEDEQSTQTLTKPATKAFARKELSNPPVVTVPPTDKDALKSSEPSIATPPASAGATVMPTALAAAGGAPWFVRPPTGGQFGPASSQLMWDWIMEKRVTFDSLLWREGMAQWQLANELIPELFGPPKPLTVPPAPPPATAINTLSPSLSTAVSNPAPVNSLPIVPVVESLSNVLAAPSTNSANNTQASSPGSLARKRREQKRRKQLTAILVLSSLSIILLVVLVVVLVMQQQSTNKTSPASPTNAAPSGTAGTSTSPTPVNP